ncbi:MAG: 16S rRNA (guanine(527)-N(7))-methyltransferase RsmG [Alphaproteobacteria bacterium]|nr:16S rRNA (guanine(527)-N(7))-methyltransferase RsmG [Alphaproteobacteria bacterium]
MRRDGADAVRDAEGFRQYTGVSRETTTRLTAYAALLRRWQRRINLVGPKTLPDLWRRHMLDSAQLLPLLPESASRVVDLGSGGGFPGLVLAALGRDRTPPLDTVHLVEADQRKAAFLREAARVMTLSDKVQVAAQRIEALPPIAADVVTARALAPVDLLLNHVQRLCGAGTPCVFLKGRRLKDELTEAKSAWYIEYRIAPSCTDSEGAILLIDDFAPRESVPGTSEEDGAHVRSDPRLDDPAEG